MNDIIDEVKVFDILGNEIYTKSFSSRDITLDLNSLTKGLYILQVEMSNKERVMKSIILQ